MLYSANGSIPSSTDRPGFWVGWGGWDWAFGPLPLAPGPGPGSATPQGTGILGTGLWSLANDVKPPNVIKYRQVWKDCSVDKTVVCESCPGPHQPGHSGRLGLCKYGSKSGKWSGNCPMLSLYARVQIRTTGQVF